MMHEGATAYQAGTPCGACILWLGVTEWSHHGHDFVTSDSFFGC